MVKNSWDFRQIKVFPSKQPDYQKPFLIIRLNLVYCEIYKNSSRKLLSI